MIHTSRTVTVGKTESIINEPIVLYRGDREVEVEFAIVGSKFTFTNGGNVIRSTNATHGQLVVDTPTGENMFSEVTGCHEGKVVFTITKEMIDELAEVGLYSFQIRLFDESQVSRVTIPPVYQGIEIRHPMAAEDETDLVDIGLVDYSVVRKNDYENVATFLPNGDYNKTNWEEHDVISRDRLNKVEDALYEINKSTEGLYPTFQNQYDEFSTKVNKDVRVYKEEMEDEVEQFERDMTQAFGEFKVNYKDEVHDRLDVVEGELARIEKKQFVSVTDFGAKGDGFTDDTESIKKAFNSVSNSHTTIFFPKGIYRVTSTLSINNVDFLTITGDASISAECHRIFQITNCNHLTVSDLNIEGNSYCNKGLSIYDSKYSNVFNVKVQNMGSTSNNNIGGIELLGDCSFSTIRNCKVFNMISSSVAFGIMISSREDAFSKHCLIDNCLIDTVVPSADADGIKFLQFGMRSYSTVSNCTILNCDKRAIKVQTEFVDIYNCYCEGLMRYSGIDFQCGNGTATDCTLKFTEPYYIGVAICGANAKIKNIKVLSDTYDPNIMSSAIRIDTIYSSIEDSMGDIVLDGIYCNNTRHALIWAKCSIVHARSLKILNMTVENVNGTYTLQFNGATVDFFQLENFTMLTKPTTMYNVVSALNMDNCIIRNNNVLGQRILSEDHPVRTKQLIYHEEIGGSYYVPYVQQDNHRVYKFNKNPMNVGGGNGNIFNQSIIGDKCENTNTTIITSGDTSYIVTEWICTSPSDETNVRGVWKEIRQYI